VQADVSPRTAAASVSHPLAVKAKPWRALRGPDGAGASDQADGQKLFATTSKKDA
jgi:hypothetical protein